MSQGIVDPVLQKIESIASAGKAAYDAGTVKLFRSFPDSLVNRFNVSVLGSFNNLSLLSSICAMAENVGIEAIIAGRDFPLHSTILEGLWESGPADRREAFRVLELDIRARSNLYQFFQDQPMIYSRLVLDAGGNLLIVAKAIPTDIVAARRHLFIVYADHGLKSLSLDNLFHCTLLRIRDVPTNTPIALNRFRDLIESFDQNGIACRISFDKFHCGPVLDLFESKP